MKFFHLSDLHIGLRLIGKDLKEDQEYIFAQIAHLAEREQPDAILIAGDLYDRAVPPAEAVELFDRFVSLLTKAAPEAELMMISGNHDSAFRINVFRNILKHRRIHMIGLPPRTPEEHIEKVVLTDSYGTVSFYLLPFVRPSMVRGVFREAVGTEEGAEMTDQETGESASLSYDETLHRLIAREQIDETERNVLVSHQFYLPAGADAGSVERMDSEIRIAGNIDSVSADVLERFDYAALGHIHKPMQVGNSRFRYSGTPLAVSVSEAGQKKGVIMVEMAEKGNIFTTVLPLTPLHEVRVITGSLDEVLMTGCGDYVRVVLTDEADLDVTDMQDRLRRAYPNLLEIRRETLRTADYRAEFDGEAEMDAFSLCKAFLKDLEAEEEDLLREIVGSVEEVPG